MDFMLDCPVQRRFANTIFGQHQVFNSNEKQPLHKRRVASSCRKMHGGPSTAISFAHFCTIDDAEVGSIGMQQLGKFSFTSFRCDVQGCFEAITFNVGIRSVLQKQLEDFRRAVVDCIMQRCPAVEILPCIYDVFASHFFQQIADVEYIIALHGTSRDSKLWPVENWIALGRELAKQNLQLALPWASEAELTRANHIQSQLPNSTVLPKLSILQVAGMISHAKAAIGVDTGLSHLAAALNIPTIAIYTDTNPALTGVMGGAFKPAINLGNIAETPSVNDVLNSLKLIL